MIAHIVPLARLPRSFETFTYQVPEHLAFHMHVGQMVHIPFRNSQKLGIVLSLEDGQHKTTLKPITNIIHPEPLVSSPYLNFIKKISDWYGISLSSLLTMSFPSFSQRSLKKIELIKFLPTKKFQSTPPRYASYINEDEHKKIIQDSIGEGQTLILVPEKQHLSVLLNFFPEELKSQIGVWHGNLKTTEKRSLWLAVRNNEKKIIIATRSGVLLPFFDLKTVCVDYEHHNEHKNADQAPRFTVKDLTEFMRMYEGVNEIHTSFSRSVSSYYFLYKGQYQNPIPEKKLLDKTVSLPKIIDMNTERKSGNTSPLSEYVEERIQTSPHDIFLLVNRKGSATGVVCKDCQFEEKCPDCSLFFVYHATENILKCHYCKKQKKISVKCPQCLSTNWIFQGLGTESLEKKVYALAPHKHILRIDGDTEHSHQSLTDFSHTPKIIIGTEKGIEYVNWEKNTLVVLLDFDRRASYPEYKTLENVWHLIDEIQYTKKKECEFVIQTSNTKHIILKSLSEPDRFYRTELNLRKSLGYPPYTSLIRFFGGNPENTMAMDQAKKFCETIENILTKMQKKGKVIGPLELQPKYFQRKFWYGILVKLEPFDQEVILKELIPFSPKDWKVDPNPESLLSP